MKIEAIKLNYADEELDNVKITFNQEVNDDNFSESTSGYIILTAEEFDGKTFEELTQEITDRRT